METQSQIYQFLRYDGLQKVRCEKHCTKPHSVSIITPVYTVIIPVHVLTVVKFPFTKLKNLKPSLTPKSNHTK